MCGCKLKILHLSNTSDELDAGLRALSMSNACMRNSRSAMPATSPRCGSIMQMMRATRNGVKQMD
jgi:hypothetical protein